jgi:tetratricopeptide (TPR) repeat protein
VFPRSPFDKSATSQWPLCIKPLVRASKFLPNVRQFFTIEGQGSSVIRVGLVGAVLLSVSSGLLSARDIGKAEELYHHTAYEESLNLLDKKSSDPATNFLLGRDYFMLGDFKKAAEYFGKATATSPENSEYMDWLGRAYGRRAEMANLLSAPGLAIKARDAFEAAVRLDGKNSEALSDLFDYYLNAPGFMGGGYEKARGIAEKIAAVDPPEGYHVKAQLAQHRKEYGDAEQALRKAVAVAPLEVGHMITLAKFLANQGRTRESDAVFAAAEKAHPAAPQLWFARADTLIKDKRNLDEAKSLLQKYVSATITVDDPPKEQAARLLKQVTQ